jgi:integrase
MARKVRNSLLESRSARLKLAVRRKPYTGSSLGRGIALLYRRNKTNGSWVAKVSDGHGQYWTKAFAEADDFDASDGKTILDFYQAQDVAKSLARRQPGEVSDYSRPATVGEALDAYERDLTARGGSVYNARHPRSHLTSVLLSKPVQLLDAKELRAWRDSLLGKGLEPASVVRYCKGLRAALNLAASHDPRIRNKAAWQTGLEALPDATVARNVILDDKTVGLFINASYAHGSALGLFVHVLAETGARPSQAARLLIEDLHGGANPRLSIPKSGKGGSKNRVARRHERVNVPISEALAARLKKAAKGRKPDAPLLLQGDGQPWSKSPSDDYREDIAEVVRAIGRDPEETTIYALRHSSIVRALKRNVPVRIVAATHDTSIVQIERTYSKYITDHSDDISRAALLQHEPPPAPAPGNVIPIIGR